VNHPRTIDDGTGARMTFLGVTHDEQGERLDVTSSVDPGAGPPMHVHHLQSESVTVRRGRIGISVEGEPERFAGPGESVTFEAGVPHRFWNAGDDELVLDGEVRPPHNMEYFLTQIYASTAAHGGRPGAFDGAFLLTRYRSEFAMTAIPAPVRRIVFPLQVLLGRMLGRYAHFADAPAPVKPATSATLPGRTTSARSSAG
jgi:quercetin dioxygenase-like cupin family protein